MLVKMKGWKKALSVVGCLLLLGVLAVNAGMSVMQAEAFEPQNREAKEEQVLDENVFVEEGTTSMGAISQTAEFSLSSALMYVEEVYVEVGSTVREGDVLFKIADDSMEDAKDYYAKAIATAQDTLKEAQVAYESGKLDAEYVKLDAVGTAEGAAATLESALEVLDADIQEKYEKWQETAYKIAAYHDNFYNNIYYKNSGIEEKDNVVVSAQTAYDEAKTAYDEAGSTYEDAKNAFDSAIAELTAVAAGTSENGMTMETTVAVVVDSYKRLAEIEPLYRTTEQASQKLNQAKQQLEQAKSEYERIEEQAKKSLEQLEETIDALEQNYETANREAETKRLELQKEYDTAILEGEYAQTVYNDTVEKLQKAVDSAKESLEKLQEEQEALLALEGGVVVANRSGTLAAVNYEAGDILFSNTPFVTYYDTTVLAVSVEVEQENISKIAVGDEVSVSVSGNRRGSVTGTVTSIASSATTGRSVSDVTYAVVISIKNERNGLSAGSSATVTFAYKDEAS